VLAHHVQSSATDAALLFQIELFNTVIGIVGITLAAAVREKKQLTRKLHQMNVDLEHTIDQRTAELRKANEESQISQRKAEQASHAKSDFLANMSHEIRTPIHGILGLTALLLESELSEDQKESLISVKECADLLLHIINSVLDLAKIEAGRLEVESVPFNIGKLVSSTLRMLQARAQERGLQLLCEVDIGVPQVLVGDVGKIQQCLLNLGEFSLVLFSPPPPLLSLSFSLT
jgi:signal transduction histidine kinase